MGRPTIFRPKDGGIVSGYISDAGRAAFEKCRGRLQRTAAKHGLTITKVSDGDVVESLARGESVTDREIGERLKEQADAT